jgi:DNA invertase Pin-like site-specific DNA recombinase
VVQLEPGPRIAHSDEVSHRFRARLLCVGTRASSRSCASQGCTEIFEEKASGTSRARPEPARLLNRLRAGDTLVVVRIDGLARSLSHLLSVIERVREAGGHFRSLVDPIDTAGPSGMLVLQIMGAIAQFERALIIERTTAGLAAAHAQGRVGGNPALRSRDPAVLGRIAAAREQTRLAALLAARHRCVACHRASATPGPVLGRGHRGGEHGAVAWPATFHP